MWLRTQLIYFLIKTEAMLWLNTVISYPHQSARFLLVYSHRKQMRQNHLTSFLVLHQDLSNNSKHSWNLSRKQNLITFVVLSQTLRTNLKSLKIRMSYSSYVVGVFLRLCG